MSILIIGRNEELRIEQCLNSISQNSYPRDLYEIIFVDDHSIDDSVLIAQNLKIPNLSILHLSDFDLKLFQGKYKKAAQYYGVLAASHELIIQTDADCVVPENWIERMSAGFNSSDLVTGPIKIINNSNVVSTWQTFENIGTMVLTFVGIRLKKWYSANGANMAYRRELFLNYCKKQSIGKHASGDDIFLINWAKKEKYKVSFLLNSNAIVSTFPESTIQDLCSQRARWASKTTSYERNGLKGIMSVLFLFHVMILLLFVMAQLFGGSYIYMGLGAIILKWIGDTVLLYRAAPFFAERYDLIRSPLFTIIHSLYVVYAGIVGLFVSNYQWKGRSVK